MSLVALILSWMIFGLVVGTFAKIIHPSKEPVGCLPTIMIGIAGSVIGGFFEWLLQFGNADFIPAGFVMSIVGSILFCCLWSWYNLKK